MTAFVALVSALLGATVQYLYAQRGEAQRYYRDLQTKAYVDFLKAAAGIAIAQRHGKRDDEFEASVLLTDAKARIAIYGSPTVAAAAAAFFREHGTLDSEDAVSAFVEMVSLMRQELARLTRSERANSTRGISLKEIIRSLLFS